MDVIALTVQRRGLTPNCCTYRLWAGSVAIDLEAMEMQRFRGALQGGVNALTAAPSAPAVAARFIARDVTLSNG